MTTTDAPKLTDEQVENWRKALVMTLGPYALIMPREDIERIRDRMQHGGGIGGTTHDHTR